MFNKIVFFMLSLKLVLLEVSALFECCPGENVILFTEGGHFCKGHNNITMNVLNCNLKISIESDDIEQYGFTFLPNATLIDSKSGKFVDYCYYYQKAEDDQNGNASYVICWDEEDDEPFFSRHKMRIQIGLTCISTTFVLLTMLVYLLVPSLLDLQGICKMHVLGGLASSYIILTIIQLNNQYPEQLCKSAAYLLYVSFFYMFFWLTVLSFDIWRTSINPNLFNDKVKWPLVYHVVGIGGAILALVVILLANYHPSDFWKDIRPEFGEQKCWFGNRKSTWIYFYGPISVLLLANVAFYLSTVIFLWKQVTTSRSKILKYRLKMCTQLCIIMGITWCIEVITFAVNTEEQSLTGQIVIFLFDSFNILQGIFIFLVLVVFRKRVRRAIANKNICNVKFPNSWRYLEDEEMESVETKINGTTVQYDGQADDEANLKLNG